MKIDDYARLMRKGWWLILAFGVLGTIVGLVISSRTAPQYRAVSSVYLHMARVDTPSDLSMVAGYMEFQTSTYAELADKPLLQTRVVDRLGVDIFPASMIDRVSTEIPEKTYSINIIAYSPDRQESVDTANTTAAVLSEYVNETEPQLDGQPVVRMDVSAQAMGATSERPSSAMFAVVGLTVGLLLGAAVTLVLPQRPSQKDFGTSRG
ncbi:hypothetical protein AVL61_07740 [Kocuria rosea subsp. polaris]|uniref:Polysaccharide chain length determinant N-terminal domain-containing protein n=1 Tax=Kocuria rosea subsp. polaris TaxID=136273 RepID=A0A0W8IMS4_KOCRO|nr:hypothetical protein [Kocuria polaris]KUG61051.1 hypothetical protein AVL61_07740 [Kocuria polaris]